MLRQSDVPAMSFEPGLLETVSLPRGCMKRFLKRPGKAATPIKYLRKNTSTWKEKTLSQTDIDKFKASCRETEPISKQLLRTGKGDEALSCLNLEL